MFEKIFSEKRYEIEIPSGPVVEYLTKPGYYDSIHPNIPTNLNFDPKQEGKWECQLVDPLGTINYNLAVTLCNSDGWSTSTSDHLIIFGEKHWGKKWTSSVAALGVSKGIDPTLVPLLLCDRYKRHFTLKRRRKVWEPPKFDHRRHFVVPSVKYLFLRVRRLKS